MIAARSLVKEYDAGVVFRAVDDVSLDVGFYYSANAAGRLVGTLLSGVLYLWGGLDAALWGSAAFVAITWVLTLRLPPLTPTAEHAPVTSIAD